MRDRRPVDLHYFRSERPLGSLPKGKREPQAGPASGLSNAAPKHSTAGGDGLTRPEPSMSATVIGEVAGGLPGSQSVARAEGDARNWGGPEGSCRTNCESQAGKAAQPQEAPSEDAPGVRSARSTPPQGTSPEMAEGADKLTQPAQATGPVHMTEQDWQTFLRAIAEKSLEKQQAPGPCQRELSPKLTPLADARAS